jgi:hypothetical protein
MASPEARNGGRTAGDRVWHSAKPVKRSVEARKAEEVVAREGMARTMMEALERQGAGSRTGSEGDE